MNLQRNYRILKYKVLNLLNMSRSDNNASKKVISIIGTTGVGKSQLSIEIAKRFNGEIINADSMQMYLKLDNITNKHPLEEREGVEHHVMNHVKWEENYFIHRFKNECEKAMEEIWSKGKIPVIVGGTHYYLQSVLFDNKTIGSKEDNRDPSKDKDEIVIRDSDKLTKEQRDLLDSEDADLIFSKLKEIDPIIANKFHPNDIRRVRRALEVYYVYGEKTSDVYERQKTDISTKGTSLKYDTLFFWIYSKLPELDKRLDSRVDKMMENGGLSELIELFQFYQDCLKNGNEEITKMDTGVWQVIGFKEFLPYLTQHGVEQLQSIENMENKEQRLEKINMLINSDKEFKKCCEEMKMKTRKYARRQVKWIKNLLGPELKDEEENGFIRFGKIYLLDATDLSVWASLVQQRGLEITDNFLKLGYVSETIAQTPETLCNEKLLNIKKLQDKKNSNSENWIHHTCEVCTDRTSGKNLVYVGDEQWGIHLKSKKHKNNLNRGKRKREYEEWLLNNKKANSEGSAQN